ncbi:MAG: DUF4381 family protein [Phycisphaerae bacterium]
MNRRWNSSGFARAGYRRRALALLVAGAALLGGCSHKTGPPPAATQPAGTSVSRKASDGPVRLTVRVDRDAITAPEPVMLTLVVEAERGVDVQMPEFKDILGGFSVAAVSAPKRSEDDLTVRTEQTVRLEAALPGEQTVPSIAAEYTDDRERADGSKETLTGTVTTEPITVRVDLALADVRDPATLPMPLSRRILFWVLGVVVVMAAIGLLARWWRRRRRRVVVESPLERRLAAHEWALAELERLIGEDLVAAGRVQEFYYRINGLVRRYIEMRFALMAAERTSEEFLREVQGSAALSEAHKRLLRDFTGACDPVKYAALEPERKDIDWVLQTARSFIEQTAATGSAGETSPPAPEPEEALA